MANKKIIEALQGNLAKFGSMKSCRVIMARQIGYKDFLRLNSVGMWVNEIVGFRNDDIYRLRPDYEEKPEVVECEVYAKDQHLHFYGDGQEHALHQAMDEVDFIGFKYEDGVVMAESRRYIGIGDKLTHALFQSPAINSIKVLTPSHVLFQVTK